MPKHHQWDGSIQVGDIVTAYVKGYHRVRRIVPHDMFAPTVYLEGILNSHFNARGVQDTKCSGNWCKKLTKEEVEQLRDKKVQQVKDGFDRLLGFFD